LIYPVVAVVRSINDLNNLVCSQGPKRFIEIPERVWAHESSMNNTLIKFWQAADGMIDGFIARLPALVVALVVFLLFHALSLILVRAVRRASSHLRQNLGLIFARLIAGTTILVGALVSLSIVTPSFQAGDIIKLLGISGVAIGFAFQNILQNFLAGLLLLWSEPFKVGDEIKLDAFEGTVLEIQARATIIKTYDEREVVIPNADLFMRSVIVNTGLNARRWDYDLTITNISELHNLRPRILAAVKSVPGVLADPAPETLIVAIDAPNSSAGKLRILWWTNTPRQHEMLVVQDQVLGAVAAALRSDHERETRRAA
jgi:small-conductance mechanosensitive channel